MGQIRLRDHLSDFYQRLLVGEPGPCDFTDFNREAGTVQKTLSAPSPRAHGHHSRAPYTRPAVKSARPATINPKISSPLSAQTIESPF